MIDREIQTSLATTNKKKVKSNPFIDSSSKAKYKKHKQI
jgi:hypothetical protein